MRKTVLAMLICGLAVLPLTAEQSPQVTATWDAPTTGSPVVVYNLQIYHGGELIMSVETPDTFQVFAPGTFVALETYLARVQGVDALDRAGPWSEWSDPYMHDPGPPGPPGGCRWLISGD